MQRLTIVGMVTVGVIGDLAPATRVGRSGSSIPDHQPT